MIVKTPNSSNIQEYFYSDIKSSQYDLYVKYNSGKVYCYKDVDSSVIDKLLTANSVGKFINAEIKGKYQFEEIDDATYGILTVNSMTSNGAPTVQKTLKKFVEKSSNMDLRYVSAF